MVTFNNAAQQVSYNSEFSSDNLHVEVEVNLLMNDKTLIKCASCLILLFPSLLFSLNINVPLGWYLYIWIMLK